MNTHEIKSLFRLLSKNPTPTDDEAFRKIMRHVGRDISVKALSDKFGVNRTTVSRWVNGKSVPHAASRLRIYTWLRSQANALLS